MTKTFLKTNSHFRSISLPSTNHPIYAQFDEQLSKLLSTETTTISCSSISHSLSILIRLYDCIDELLLQPSGQQVISRNSQAKWVDDVLEGSLKLIDVCGVARDALFSMKECLQGVQSLLRRSSGELTIRKGVSEYINSRNNIKKGIRQCLKSTRSTVNFDSVFHRVEVATIDVLKSLLSYIAGVKSQSSKLNMSMVVRLMYQFSDCDKTMSVSEFEDIDAKLRSLISRKKSVVDTTQIDSVMSRMVTLEDDIEEVIEELDCLFRHLVKTRVNLLNILSY